MTIRKSKLTNSSKKCTKPFQSSTVIFHKTKNKFKEFLQTDKRYKNSFIKSKLYFQILICHMKLKLKILLISVLVLLFIAVFLKIHSMFQCKKKLMSAKTLYKCLKMLIKVSLRISRLFLIAQIMNWTT